jgi:LPXTG-motif cell wall-anchored protein
VARATGVAIVPREVATGWVALRATIDAGATLAYLIALFHLPLANAIAINMATPLFITVLAVWWHRAQVSGARWIAIAVGFGGVLLVIQPDAVGFNMFAWLCLLGTLLAALRDLVTLRIAAAMPNIVITLATAVTVTLMAAVLCAVQGWQALTLAQLGWLAAAAVFLASGYHLVIRATRAGDLSVVAPFRYSGLLLAVLLGWLVWDDWPNALAWAGIALLLGAGLFLLRRS